MNTSPHEKLFSANLKTRMLHPVRTKNAKMPCKTRHRVLFFGSALLSCHLDRPTLPASPLTVSTAPFRHVSARKARRSSKGLEGETSDVATTTATEEQRNNKVAEEQSAPTRTCWSWAYPKNFKEVGLIALVFASLLLGTTVPQGLGYERFKTRAADCYDSKNYYKFDEARTASDPFCRVFSYPYRLIDPTLRRYMR